MSKEREAFVAQLVRALPNASVPWVEHQARLLMRHAVTHGRLAVESCNGHPANGRSDSHMPIATINKLQDKWDARIAKREAQIEKRIAAICSELGLTVDFGGDPRGYTVKLHLPNGACNTWGQDGYGVPQ